MRFCHGPFTSHSGLTLQFKIDCDDLTDGDLNCLARIIGRQMRFSRIVGVPRGGLRLAEALAPYAQHLPAPVTLIVDDVLTTGASMEQIRATTDDTAIGVVIVARRKPPTWIVPVLSLNQLLDS
jgi:orotate phosphoribosyltransferase